MPRDTEFWREDDSCTGCGDTHFIASRTPGLCTECATMPSWDPGDRTELGSWDADMLILDVG